MCSTVVATLYEAALFPPVAATHGFDAVGSALVFAPTVLALLCACRWDGPHGRSWQHCTRQCCFHPQLSRAVSTLSGQPCLALYSHGTVFYCHGTVLLYSLRLVGLRSTAVRATPSLALHGHVTVFNAIFAYRCQRLPQHAVCQSHKNRCRQTDPFRTVGV